MSGTCTQCPKGSFCDKTSTTTCPAGFYSDAGWGICANAPYGSQPDASAAGGLTTCVAPEYFDAATGTCKNDCPQNVICDPLTGAQSTCQWGQYVKNSDKTCQEADAGKVGDGVTESNAAANTVSYASTGQSFDCFAAKDCSSAGKNAGNIADCNAGFYSLHGDNGCTESDYLYEQDMAGAVCPDQTYRETTGRRYCVQSDIDKKASGASATSDTGCNPGDMSWFGEDCSNCDTTHSGHKCSAMEYRNNILCPPGHNVSGGICVEGNVEHIEQEQGLDRNCRDGMVTEVFGVLTKLPDR